MNRFENMTYAQIAVELDLSVSMIEKHISHAIAYLRKSLADERATEEAQSLRPSKQRNLIEK
jgi:DNA-directed RNA polymerase specialized sigma24 family protein